MFHARYQSSHGPTDLTKRYTSTWPTSSQQWLFEHRPQEWFDGLPPFAKSFLAKRVSSLIEAGKIEPTKYDNIRRHWIKTGPAEEDRIDRYWLEQYLRGPVRAAEEAVAARAR